MSDDPKPVAEELAEARVTEVVEAVGEAFKGEGNLGLDSVDLDHDTLRTAIDDAVRSALDISPLKALEKAWKSVNEVRKLTSSDGPHDGKERKVAIASHTLKTKHVPEIHVELGKVATLKKIPVPVEFTLKIEGLVLTVLDRNITGISAGHAQPEVTVKVEGVTVVKEKLRRINLPLNIKLYEASPEQESA